MPSSPEQALRNELAQARAHIGVVEGREQQTSRNFEQRLQGMLSLTGERDNEMVASLRQRDQALQWASQEEQTVAKDRQRTEQALRRMMAEETHAMGVAGVSHGGVQQKAQQMGEEMAQVMHMYRQECHALAQL